MFFKNEDYPDTDEVSVEENLGLVRLCANRFRGKGIEYDELYSAGCVGLVKASKAFDKTRGVRFSTYAVPVILGEIKRLFRDGGSVKVSRAIKERSLKVSRLRESFEKENGREPTFEELMVLSSLDSCELSEALCVMSPTVSLNGNDGEPKDTDIPVPPCDEKIINSLALGQALESFEEKDRLLIYLRFSLDLTQEKTAQRLNMSQVQVSRREKKILSELKKML